MDSPDKLIEARKQAEAAVAEMADGDLKVKAFEVILVHVLASTASTPPASEVAKPTTASKPSSSRVPGTAKSRILLLKDEGFFSRARSMADINHELKAHGWIHPNTALSGPLQGLVQERRLRRLKGKSGKKTVWTYVNP
jgi:hypothetical protein